MAASTQARGALFSSACGVVLGAVTLVTLRVGRSAIDDGLVLGAVLVAGVASGAASAPRYFRRWGRAAWPRATATLALALALGRPLWDHVPGLLGALWTLLPTRLEQRVVGALVLLPLAAVPAHWLACAAGSALARLHREQGRPQAPASPTSAASRGPQPAHAALMAALVLPLGGLLAWLAVSVVGPKRAMTLTTLLLATAALVLERGLGGRGSSVRAAAVGTAVLLFVP
jgi:hypothetical protein